MKKALIIGSVVVTVIALGLLVFWGHKLDHPDTNEPKPPEVSCQVRSIEEDGLILYIPLDDSEGNPIDHVYVKNVDVDFEIQPLDTVVLEVTFEELVPKKGTFTDFFEQEGVYSHILEQPRRIRLTEGNEPTYG